MVANVVAPAPETCGPRRTTVSGLISADAADPESKGIVENLVGYAKSDLIVPQVAVL